jgi:hypothetical protein
MRLIFVFFGLFLGFSSFYGTIQANSLFHPPVGEDFFLHPGEGFCDEMYQHSYTSRTFHTAEDYIRKWKKKHILKGEDDLAQLEKLQLKHYGHLPKQAHFWEDTEKRKAFLKINLYRQGLPIIDTKLGLYPRTETDESYGYGENFFAVYDGKVIASLDIEQPVGWGKAMLLQHKAPEGQVFEIYWNNKLHRLPEFWTQYSHNETHLVEMNDEVKKGEILGTIGDGNGIFHSLHGKDKIREGAHLHFEIRIQNYSLFPTKSLLRDKNKVMEVFIEPSYFLQNAKLVSKD